MPESGPKLTGLQRLGEGHLTTATIMMMLTDLLTAALRPLAGLCQRFWNAYRSSRVKLNQVK